MSTWLTLAALLLLAVAAFGLWRAIQSPSFVAGLTALAARVAAKTIVTKVTARKPEAEEEFMNAEIRAGRGGEYQRNEFRRRRKARLGRT